MYTEVKKLREPARIELWIVTGFIALAILLSLVDSIMGSNYTKYSAMPSLTNNVITVLFPHLLAYICYLFLIFYISPEFKTNEKISNNTLVVFLLIAACILFHVINIYIAALLAIKLLLIFLNRNKANKENTLYYETSLVLASWILTVAFCNSLMTNIYVVLYVYNVVPAAIIVYLYCMHAVLPKVALKKYGGLRFTGRMLFLAFITSITLFAVLMLRYFDHESLSFHLGTAMGPNIFGLQHQTILLIVGLNFVTQFFLMLPFTWITFKNRHKKQVEEIEILRTELGKSDANLNLLKSQINPHFLFNSLNTLYGTALQERAERTGEGIQKLGDMMRFMLQENMQDKIPLSRDVEYLKNYILLQKLRTSVSEEVSVHEEIEDQQNNLQIAPMLLIPFVENAFKHGISLINPSHIRITLQTKGNILYFDVHNSIHIKLVNDPEKGQSGIGLENVKQRLILLYSGKHELIIRKNANEFFVHLTLELEEAK